jgi:hypothetical protein
MQYKIEISERLSRVIDIDANSLEDAIAIAQQMYKKEDIVLDWADFDGNVIIVEFIKT